MPVLTVHTRFARLAPANDTALLRAFVEDRCETAFADLVRRHGPTVLGVCRRVLHDPHDADDAFQATWMVLARRARTVNKPDRLPGWLHAVAVRAATEVRRMRGRRRASESALDPAAGPPAPVPPDPDLAAVLDEELSRLPERYRQAVVLCELEGQPRRAAATRLGVPEGTLSSRLAKARKLLAERLAARGVGVTAAALGAVLAPQSQGGLSAALVVGVARAACGMALGAGPSAASAAATSAADAVVKAMLVTKLRGYAAVAVLAAIGLAASGAGAAAGLSPAVDDRPTAPKQPGGADQPRPGDHPAWRRYARLAGDTPVSRKLFAAMIADPVRAGRLAEAEARPDTVARQYAAQLADPADSPPDLATMLLLGDHPGATAEWSPTEQPEWVFKRPGFAAAVAGEAGGPVRALYARWLETRTVRQTTAEGLVAARNLGLAGCLPAARRMAADPERSPQGRADALLLVGQFGTPADAALARPLLVETGRHGTIFIGDPARGQVRDTAAAALLLLLGQRPGEYGIVCGLAIRADGSSDERNLSVAGFRSDEAREAAHRAVRAFDEAAGKPAPAPPAKPGAIGDLAAFLAEFRADAGGVKAFAHPLWVRFSAAAGSDAAARALFAEVVADPARAERLAAAVADPATAGKLYAAEVDRVREYSRTFVAAYQAKLKHLTPEDWSRHHDEVTTAVQAQLAADPPAGRVGALLFLGTFPASAGVSLGAAPTRVQIDAVPVGSGALPRPDKAAGPWAPAARCLFAAWLTVRADTEDRTAGLKAATAAGVAEALPAARRWVADPLVPPSVRGLCLPLLARFGGPADRLLAEALIDNPASVTGGARRVTVGDLALAVSVHLAGGRPADYGIDRPAGPPDWSSVPDVGFDDEGTRRAATARAKAWVAARP